MNTQTLSNRTSSHITLADMTLEDGIETEPTQQELDECERLVQSLDLIELLQNEEE